MVIGLLLTQILVFSLNTSIKAFVSIFDIKSHLVIQLFIEQIPIKLFSKL